MSSEIHLVISGAAGRMGRRLVAMGSQNPHVRIVAGLSYSGDPLLGTDIGELAGIGTLGITLSDDLDPNVMPHVMIDFSSLDGFRHWLPVCRRRKIAMLVGTTGLTDADHREIDTAAHEIAILQTTNTSVGVAVLNYVAAQMTKMLGPDFDIEIIEQHHHHKKDAPSGTAATLADHILKARGESKEKLVYGRHGGDALRGPGTIGMHSLRLGDVVGEHTAHFCGEGERLSITHIANSRDTFVKGALRASVWLAAHGAGRYTIEDVLGIGTGKKSKG
jgi:4-hydroxy-tetrahydrodipicolinate reductase